MTEGGGSRGRVEGKERRTRTLFTVVPSRKKKSEGGEGGGGDPAFTFWLINGSFFDYRLLCDAYLASLGFHPPLSPPLPCVARYSTAREKILGSMTLVSCPPLHLLLLSSCIAAAIANNLGPETKGRRHSTDNRSDIVGKKERDPVILMKSS